MSLRNKLRFVGLTDTGKVREHNEDTIAVDPDIGLVVLADGMGGYNAGEVASGIAVKTIVNLVREHVEREDLGVPDRESGLSRPNLILRDALSRANKNYVTRALGDEQSVDVEIQEVPTSKGELFILCSDGLSDMVEDEDIHLTINTFSANLDTVAKQLIQLANDNGGRDNVSVVMAHIMDAFPARTKIFDKILGWFG